MRLKPQRPMLERYRDWLLQDVIPGFQRQHGEESVQRAMQQLTEINEKLRQIKYPREKKSDGPITLSTRRNKAPESAEGYKDTNEGQIEAKNEETDAND